MEPGVIPVLQMGFQNVSLCVVECVGRSCGLIVMSLTYVGSSELWCGGAGRSDLRSRRRERRNGAGHC